MTSARCVPRSEGVLDLPDGEDSPGLAEIVRGKRVALASCANSSRGVAVDARLTSGYGPCSPTREQGGRHATTRTRRIPPVRSSGTWAHGDVWARTHHVRLDTRASAKPPSAPRADRPRGDDETV